MFLNSISHTVCKFHKDWMKNKKNANFVTVPLNKSYRCRGALVFFFLLRLLTPYNVCLYLFSLPPQTRTLFMLKASTYTLYMSELLQNLPIHFGTQLLSHTNSAHQNWTHEVISQSLSHESNHIREAYVLMLRWDGIVFQYLCVNVITTISANIFLSNIWCALNFR